MTYTPVSSGAVMTNDLIARPEDVLGIIVECRECRAKVSVEIPWNAKYGRMEVPRKCPFGHEWKAVNAEQAHDPLYLFVKAIEAMQEQNADGMGYTMRFGLKADQ